MLPTWYLPLCAFVLVLLAVGLLLREIQVSHPGYLPGRPAALLRGVSGALRRLSGALRGMPGYVRTLRRAWARPEYAARHRRGRVIRVGGLYGISYPRLFEQYSVWVKQHGRGVDQARLWVALVGFKHEPVRVDVDLDAGRALVYYPSRGHLAVAA